MEWSGVKSTIKAKLSSTLAGTTLDMENVAGVHTDRKAWVRATIKETAITRSTITGDSATGRKYWGNLLLQVFVPADTGSDATDTIVDLLQSTFFELVLGNKESGWVVFDSNVITDNSQEEGWYQVNLTFPFYHENI